MRKLCRLYDRLPERVKRLFQIVCLPVSYLIGFIVFWGFLAPIWRIFGVIVWLALVWVSVQRAFVRPPVPCHMYVGKPGSGKSTLLVKLIYQAKKAGKKVFCTDRHIADRMSVEYVSAQDLLRDDVHDCVVFIDEAGLEYDNRFYKTFPKQLIAFYRLHRHRSVEVHLMSQQYDVDKRIRDVCDGFSLVKPFLGFWILERRVDIVIRLISAEVASDSVARIVDDLQKRSIWRHGLRFHWAPKYWRLFDSYDTSRLDMRTE